MNITIDNKVCECKKGEYLLTVARRNEIFIPTLCAHEGLDCKSSCRVCIVEVVIDGTSKIVTSCIYPIEKQCEVYTDSEQIKQDRAMILALLREKAPESSRIATLAQHYNAPASKRFVRELGNKCILCGICVLACNSLGAGAIAAMNRGTTKKLATPYGEPSNDCIGCGSCAAICPTGHIDCEQDDAQGTRTLWGRIFTLARCTQCGITIGTTEQVKAVRDDGKGVLLCDSCKQKQVADKLAFVYAP